MTTPSTVAFKQIDSALEQYYTYLNVKNYRDDNDVGLFLHYVIKEELDDPTLPIKDELGDECDPNDCTYAWLWNNNNNLFPIPSYAQITYKKTEIFIFYVLQYCYKHTKPPSDTYIQQIIISKCNGTLLNTSYVTYVIFISKNVEVINIL